jgi:hypothetical protein
VKYYNPQSHNNLALQILSTASKMSDFTAAGIQSTLSAFDSAVRAALAVGNLKKVEDMETEIVSKINSLIQ